MIILINGPFGVGKTTVAESLVAALPNALLYDPEEVGLCLRAILRPIDNPEDFQDLYLWPRLTVELAARLRETYHRDLVVPMTIWRRDLFAYILEGFRTIDEDTHHFALIAQPATIRERLRTRGDGKGSFADVRVDLCLGALTHPDFAPLINTEDRTLIEVRNILLDLVGK